MTPEELKAHRRAICEALIEGIPVQVKGYDGEWGEGKDDSVASMWLFDGRHDRVRIKSEPRKCWIGWGVFNDARWTAWSEESRNKITEQCAIGTIKWQLVIEDTTNH